jgi:hypothetical protein
MRLAGLIITLLILATCSKQPTDKAPAPAESSTDKQIAKDSKSIEQAADEAAKLIEDDARQDAPAPNQ